MESRFIDCFNTNRFILTEGAVGQRVEREFFQKPNADISYASLLYDPDGRAALSAVYGSYLQVAEDYHLPILLFTNTRRANKDRVLRSSYSDKNMMRDFTNFLRELASAYTCQTYIGGMMGCRGNAYSGTEGMDTEEAVAFHAWQLDRFDLDSLDFLIAGIMPSLPEAVGMARVMGPSNLPYIISLMVNREGTLLDGNTIHKAIETIDASVQPNPLCYITNCVHPMILKEALSKKENRTDAVKSRFLGIQANAAYLSPEELDNHATLQTTAPKALAADFLSLHTAFPLKIYGGCCGTDNSHLVEMIKRLY